MSVDIEKLSLNELAERTYQTSVEHGWWEEEGYNFGEKLALIHSEVSEALESWRGFEAPFYMHGDKPEGWGTELCDVIIRIFDLMRHEGLDIEQILLSKADFNDKRPYKHGGKRI